jgi:hypothetical protein
MSLPENVSRNYAVDYALGRDPGAYWPGDEYISELALARGYLPPVVEPPAEAVPSRTWDHPDVQAWIQFTLRNLADTYVSVVRESGADSDDAQLVLGQIRTWESGSLPPLLPGGEPIPYRLNDDDTTHTIPPVPI